MTAPVPPRRYHTATADYGGDTTQTKIFVGGLAWETRRDTMRLYFEQFGEIVEAVVIVDKNTGRSKGYGFVTFRDPEAARMACLDPAPVIDGRRANCNLASEGHHRPPPPQLNPPTTVLRPIRPVFPQAPLSYNRLAFLNQPTNYTLPYWYPNIYSQDNVYPFGYYNFGAGNFQQFPYYTPGTSTILPGYYNPYNYGSYAQPNPGSSSSSGSGFVPPYGQMMPYQYLTQLTPGLIPFSATSILPGTGLNMTTTATMQPGGSLQSPNTGPDQNNSA